MRTYEGKIEISLEEFGELIQKNFLPEKVDGDYITLGVPRVNVENRTVEIDYAGSSETDPKEWAEKPRAVTQWEGPPPPPSPPPQG